MGYQGKTLETMAPISQPVSIIPVTVIRLTGGNTATLSFVPGGIYIDRS
jgi:hypothetical protein